MGNAQKYMEKLRHVHKGEEGIPFPSDDDISQTCDGDLDCDEDDDIITGLVKVNPKSHIESSNKIIKLILMMVWNMVKMLLVSIGIFPILLLRKLLCQIMDPHN